MKRKKKKKKKKNDASGESGDLEIIMTILKMGIWNFRTTRGNRDQDCGWLLLPPLHVSSQFILLLLLLLV